MDKTSRTLHEMRKIRIKVWPFMPSSGFRMKPVFHCAFELIHTLVAPMLWLYVILLFILLGFNLVCLSLQNAFLFLFSQFYWCWMHGFTHSMHLGFILKHWKARRATFMRFSSFSCHFTGVMNFLCSFFCILCKIFLHFECFVELSCTRAQLLYII